jgi:hypothetical protein
MRNAALLSLAILTACGGNSEGADETKVSAITYQRDIRPLMDAHCVRCHTDGGIAPFVFESWADVAPLTGLIVASVDNRSMPPWGQDPDCREAVGSKWLGDTDLQAFLDWRAGDYAEGDEADYVPGLPPVADVHFGDPDRVYAPAEGYVADIALTDDYRCQPVDEALDTDLFLRMVRVSPGNLDIAHHAILYAIPESGRAEMEALDAADPAPGYTCFGDSGLDDAQTLGGWVPGSSDSFFADGTAIRVPAGATLVLQMHYNTAGLESAPEPDLSAIELWTYPEGEFPEYLINLYPVVVTSLDIRAGDAASVQTSTQRVPADALIVGSAPHMHLLGQTLVAKIIRPDGSEECLSKIDNWDFQWQRSYGFDESDWVPISIDDQIQITCTYDNSADNQPVVNGERQSPRDVTWGDGSFDEMCLNYLALLAPYYGDGGGGTCDGFDVCNADCAEGDAFCSMSCMNAAGESCFYCGIDGLFGDCTVAACGATIFPLYQCLLGCAEGDEQFIGCMYDECRTEFEPYYACAQDVKVSVI